MGFGEELTNLGEDMIGSFDGRVKFLGQNCVDVKNLRFDARKLIHHFSKEHKAMGKKLRADLGGFVDDLSGTVDALRNKFQRQQKAIHQECKAAHQAWGRVAKALANKRKNFKPSLAKAKQSATRVH